MIETGAVGIAGSNHDISTGVVNFYDDTLITKFSELKKYNNLLINK